MKINFLFCETDRKSINLDVLFYAEQDMQNLQREWLQLFLLVGPYIIVGGFDSF